MPYVLIHNDWSAGRAEISAADHDRLSRAHAILKTLLEIEEAFALYKHAHFDFEHCLLTIAAEQAYRIHDRSASAVATTRRILNLRLGSLLSTSRFYVDCATPRLDRLSALVGARASAKDDFAALASQHFEIRFMQALRNHVQHEALAAHSLGHTSDWLWQGETGQSPRRMRIGSAPVLDVHTLRQASDFERRMGRELAAMSCKQIDLTWLVRRHAGILNAFHAGLRQRIWSETDQAMADLSHAIQAAFPGQAVGAVALVHAPDDGPSQGTGFVEVMGCAEARDRAFASDTVQTLHVSGELIRRGGVWPERDDDIWIVD